MSLALFDTCLIWDTYTYTHLYCDLRFKNAIRDSYVYNKTNFSHRKENGLCLFLVDLSPIWSFIHVLWATVNAVIRVVSEIAHVSSYTHTVILTCNVIVIDKVRNTEQMTTVTLP